MDKMIGWASRNHPLLVVQLNMQWILMFLKRIGIIYVKKIACAAS